MYSIHQPCLHARVNIHQNSDVYAVLYIKYTSIHQQILYIKRRDVYRAASRRGAPPSRLLLARCLRYGHRFVHERRQHERHRHELRRLAHLCRRRPQRRRPAGLERLQRQVRLDESWSV